MNTAGLRIEHNASGIPAFAHIGLRKSGKEKQHLYTQVDFNKCFKIKESDEYTDTEILVYNSMINAAGIIAKNS